MEHHARRHVPTAIELACADPHAPCSLPNDFVSDPRLRPLVSRTFEAGARGALGASSGWSVAVYHTTIADDLQFVAASATATTTGFFRNVGGSRRQGLELSAHTAIGPVSLTSAYGWVDATYRSTWQESSPANLQRRCGRQHRDPSRRSDPRHSGAHGHGARRVHARPRVHHRHDARVPVGDVPAWRREQRRRTRDDRRVRRARRRCGVSADPASVGLRDRDQSPGRAPCDARRPRHERRDRATDSIRPAESTSSSSDTGRPSAGGSAFAGRGGDDICTTAAGRRARWRADPFGLVRPIHLTSLTVRLSPSKRALRRCRGGDADGVGTAASQRRGTP